jgi:DNA mismatch repair ATPase MutS
METDKTTLYDLSILNADDDFSVFEKVNCCRTSGGKERLMDNFLHPLTKLSEIQGIQQTLKIILQKQQYWPTQISNGSIMVIEKFYLTAFDDIPAQPGFLSTYSYKILHAPDFSLVKYSVEHCFDFIKGMIQLVEHFNLPDAPEPMKKILVHAAKLLKREQFLIIEKKHHSPELELGEQLALGHYFRNHYKNSMLELLFIYFQLDAWYGMAMAIQQYQLVFPEFIESAEPLLEAKDLYHILLPNPVSYDVSFDEAGNFMFLTGANMAGKSTFIKSVGTAVFLAHLGMGVPAKQMKLSLFDGLLSNINVVDNLVKGESFFYNEVQRIKATVAKVSDKRKWLILIDELFKGTNVQDAMKCSSAVIEGLIKIKPSLFILSTHLYEIGEALKQYPNISFCYFETAVVNEQLCFSYLLKKGISNDRLGYLILRNEGVVEMLEKLG